MRANTSGRTARSLSWPANGRFRVVNRPLRDVVNLAYDLRSKELGLELQPILSQVDGYVIERIERPTPN